jgi:hypothetical protein
VVHGDVVLIGAVRLLTAIRLTASVRKRCASAQTQREATRVHRTPPLHHIRRADTPHGPLTCVVQYP